MSDFSLKTQLADQQTEDNFTPIFSEEKHVAEGKTGPVFTLDTPD